MQGAEVLFKRPEFTTHAILLKIRDDRQGRYVAQEWREKYIYKNADDKLNNQKN
jgi:hypothetical protein